MICGTHLHYYLLYPLDVFLLVFFSILFYNFFIILFMEMSNRDS